MNCQSLTLWSSAGRLPQAFSSQALKTPKFPASILFNCTCVQMKKKHTDTIRVTDGHSPDPFGLMSGCTQHASRSGGNTLTWFCCGFSSGMSKQREGTESSAAHNKRSPNLRVTCQGNPSKSGPFGTHNLAKPCGV